jgi:hypothetical protein
MSAVRFRYLIKHPDVYSAHPMPRIVRGQWERVWRKKWEAYRGEKKVVSGGLVILYPAERGWA